MALHEAVWYLRVAWLIRLQLRGRVNGDTHCTIALNSSEASALGGVAVEVVHQTVGGVRTSEEAKVAAMTIRQTET